MYSNSYIYIVEVYMCVIFWVICRIVFKMIFFYGDNIVVCNNLCFSYIKVRFFLIIYRYVVGGIYDYILIF